MDNLIKALQIMSKYMNGYNLKYPTHCEHDVFRVSCDPADVSEEDKAELDKLGFIPDEEFDGFMSYHYGSA